MIRVIIEPFGIETVARDTADIAVAVREAIVSMIIVAERFGEGFEKEISRCGGIGRHDWLKTSWAVRSVQVRVLSAVR